MAAEEAATSILIEVAAELFPRRMSVGRPATDEELVGVNDLVGLGAALVDVHYQELMTGCVELKSADRGRWIDGVEDERTKVALVRLPAIGTVARRVSPPC